LRLAEAQRQVGLALGGKPGSRAGSLCPSAGTRSCGWSGRSGSRRPTCRACSASTTGPGAAGRTYGTILCDLERRQGVDLLGERSADALAVWLAARPGIAIIARDRGGRHRHNSESSDRRMRRSSEIMHVPPTRAMKAFARAVACICGVNDFPASAAQRFARAKATAHRITP